MKLANALDVGPNIQIIPDFGYRPNPLVALAECEEAANHLIRQVDHLKMGPLAVAPTRHLNDAFACLRVRSQPLPWSRGVEFWHNCDVIDAHVPIYAALHDLTRAASLFDYWTSTPELAAFDALCTMDQDFASKACDGNGFEMVARGIGDSAHPAKITIFLLIRMLGDDLLLGYDTVELEVGACRNVNQIVDNLIRIVNHRRVTHAKRSLILSECLRKGIRGYIDSTALALLSVTDFTMGEVIEVLKQQKKLRFACIRPKVEGSFKWKNGTIIGSFRDGRVRLKDDSLMFHMEIPEILRVALTGKPLKKVMEAPYCPASATIKGVQEFSFNMIWMDLEIESFPIERGAFPQ